MVTTTNTGHTDELWNDPHHHHDDEDHSLCNEQTSRIPQMQHQQRQRISYFYSFLCMTFMAYLFQYYHPYTIDIITRYLYIPPGPPPPPPLFGFGDNVHHHHSPQSEDDDDDTTQSSPFLLQTHESSTTNPHVPSPHISWNEYIHVHTYHLLHSFLALGIQTPYYIFTHALRSFIADVQIFYLQYHHHHHHHHHHPWYIRTILQYYMTTSTMARNDTHQTSSSQLLLCQWNVPPLLNRINHSTNDHSNDKKNHTSIVIGQDMAMEYVRNAMYTWTQQQQSTATSSTTSSTTKQPLVLFATGYEHTGKHTLAHHIATTYRTNCDPSMSSSLLLLQIHGHDWKLQQYEIDVDDIENTNRYRRRLYRKLIHVIESHYYNLQQQHQRLHQYSYHTTSTTYQNPPSPPNMILISNMEDMDSVVLLQLLSTLRPPQQNPTDSIYHRIIIPNDPNEEDMTDFDTTDGNVGNPSTQQHTLRQFCQNTIIYLTSNQYGVSAIARHLRNGGLTTTTSSFTTTTTIPSITLTSDIRDIVQRELQDTTNEIFNTVTILPFVPFTSAALEQLLRHRIDIYYTATVRQLTTGVTATAEYPSTIVVTNRAIQAILDDRNIEYIEWRAKSKSSTTAVASPETTITTSILKMVVEGANAIQDQIPVVTKLYTQLHQVLETLLESAKQLPSTTGTILVLDYDTTSTITLYDRGMFHWCDSTILDTNDKSKYRIASSTFTDHNCQVVRRFQL